MGKNGWVKKDEGALRNLEYIKALYDMYKELKDTVTLSYSMVKSHDDTLEAMGLNVAFNEAKKAIKAGPKVQTLKPVKADEIVENITSTGSGVKKKENEVKN